MIPEHLVNPYNIDPALDCPHEPQQDENWTEYRYFFAFDADRDIGISLHIGRLVADRLIWRGILYIFLPQREVLVRKYSGRNGSKQSIGAGPLVATCVEPQQLWTLDFDGVVNSIGQSSLAYELARDGVDELIQFHLVLEAAAPLQILGIDTMKGLNWSRYHTEQIHSMRGHITYRGKTLSLKGVGSRDHSSGPRDSSKVIGAFWANVLFPSGKAFNINLVSAKNFEIRTGYAYWGDGTPAEHIEILSAPAINTPETPLNSVPADVMNESPKFTIKVASSRGTILVQVERLRTVASTYVPPHHEIAGTDLNRAEAAQMTKTAARFTMDGEIGYGQMDRFVRIETLQRQTVEV